MSDAEKITLTPDELAALIDGKLAERDRLRDAEAQRLYDLRNPTFPPAPPLEPASDELIAEFAKALDAAKGNVDEAVQAIARRLKRDINWRYVDSHFGALYDQWSIARECLHFAVQMGMVKNLLLMLQRRREQAKVASA